MKSLKIHDAKSNIEEITSTFLLIMSELESKTKFAMMSVHPDM